jgi:lipoprotein LpqH
VDIRFLARAGATLLVGVTAACSSPAPAPARPGTIPAGSADVTVNGQKLATSQAVDCTFIQSFMTITTGDGVAGTTTVVDNADRLAATSVDIRDLGGFTGSYWRNLAGEATVAMTGRTFTITGTAEGFDAENPSARVARPFSIKASC